MSDNNLLTPEMIIKLLITLALLSFFVLRKKHKKEIKIKLEGIYPEFVRRSNLKTNEIFKQSIKLFPSVNEDNEEEWFKIIERQAGYQNEEMEKFYEEIKKEYNLTDAEFNIIKNRYLTEEFSKLKQFLK